MSLDVSLRNPPREVACICACCGNEHKKEESEELFEANITHNLGGMATAAGLYKAMWRPEEIGAKLARDIIPILEAGIKRLREIPDKFKMLNPANGWGNYEALLCFTVEYLAACMEHPDAEIHVNR